MTEDTRLVIWGHDDPDNPWQRPDRSHIHRMVGPGAAPCTCIHCQPDDADTDNQQEDETP